MRFYLIEIGIEANPDKREAFIKMNFPSTKKEVVKFNRILTAMNHFFSKSAQHAFPFYTLLRDEAQFKWI